MDQTPILPPHEQTFIFASDGYSLTIQVERIGILFRAWVDCADGRRFEARQQYDLNAVTSVASQWDKAGRPALKA